MAPQEDSLGARHHSINKRTNDTVKKKIPFSDVQKLAETCDADRLYKIDVAAEYRNVAYIIENLKSEDCLYVSRAINKSPWLITDSQYADIVNPHHLENDLFPFMNTKAVCKLKLELRLKLRDEKRCEEFFEYFKQKNMKEALKWLPKCSVPFIEQYFTDDDNVRTLVEDKSDLFKRLCERTGKIFEIVSSKYEYYANLKCATFVLYTHPEIFLKFYEHKMGNKPKLSKHATKFIMTKYYERFMSKIQFYILHIDLDVLGKLLGPSRLLEFLDKLHEIESLACWFTHGNLKPLIKHLKETDKVEFIKKYFTEKTTKQQIIDTTRMMVPRRCCRMSAPRRLYKKGKSLNMSAIYKCYADIPFPLAFAEIKKLIRKESLPNERTEMFLVLISSAGKNPNNVFLVIEQFRKYHINEPSKYKQTFVNALLKSTKAYLYDEKTWKLLDEILHSLEVYTSEDVTVSRVICETIVTRCLILNVPIPELILKKFMNEFSTLKNVIDHLDSEKQDRVYNFLRDQLETREEATQKNDFSKILQLMKDWNKNLRGDKIMKILEDLIKNDDDINLTNFYVSTKKWRRDLFEYSLILVDNQDVFMNALKHNPGMILENRKVLDKIIKSDKLDLTKILRKMRVYFPESHGKDLLKYYETKLQQFETDNLGYRATTRGICILMNRDRFTDVAKQFVPVNYTIEWSEENTGLINIRKYLAQQMYLVRPEIEIDTILMFAKGDYLQYALSSILSVCYKKSRHDVKTIVPRLIEEHVSLQKHGVRLGFAKLNDKEIDETFRNVWNSTKNLSIRAAIFKSAFILACRERDDSEFCWKLLKTFMQNLTSEENGTIYAMMVRVDDVPKSIRGEFCMMSFNILKSLPPKANCQELAKKLFIYMLRKIDCMPKDAIEALIVEFLNKMFSTVDFSQAILGYSSDMVGFYDVFRAIECHILHCRDKDDQMRRYNVLLKKIVDECLQRWNEINDGSKIFQKFIKNFVKSLVAHARNDFCNSSYVNPKSLFQSLSDAVKEVNQEENFKLEINLKLMLEYCDAYDEVTSKIDNMELQKSELTKIVGANFGRKIIVFVKRLSEQYFPSVLDVFIEIMVKFLQTNVEIFQVFKALTSDPKDIKSCLAALYIVRKCTHFTEDEEDITCYETIKNNLSLIEDKEIRFYYKLLENRKFVIYHKN